MRSKYFLSLALLMLGGCGARVAGADGSASHGGRYEGIGVYDAGRGWQHMAGEEKRGDARATFGKDEHVIVTVDTNSGEVRQCGDHSGFCVSMNPWTRALGPTQQLPVALTPEAEEPRSGNVEAADLQANSNAK